MPTTIYNNIKALCDENNMSVREFETSAGLKVSAVSNCKRSALSSDTLLVIARYFDVSTDFILGNTDNRYSHKDKFSKASNAILKTCEKHPLSEKSTVFIQKMIKAASEILDDE